MQQQQKKIRATKRNHGRLFLRALVVGFACTLPLLVEGAVTPTSTTSPKQFVAKDPVNPNQPIPTDVEEVESEFDVIPGETKVEVGGEEGGRSPRRKRAGARTFEEFTGMEVALRSADGRYVSFLPFADSKTFDDPYTGVMGFSCVRDLSPTERLFLNRETKWSDDEYETLPEGSVDIVSARTGESLPYHWYGDDSQPQTTTYKFDQEENGKYRVSIPCPHEGECVFAIHCQGNTDEKFEIVELAQPEGIRDITYHSKAGEGEPGSKGQKIFKGEETAYNCDNKSSKFDVEVRATTSESYAWELGGAVTAGMKVSLEGGVPFFWKAKTELSAEMELRHGTVSTTSRSNIIRVKAKPVVDAMSKRRVYMMATTSTEDISWTGKLGYHESSSVRPVRGTFKGSLTHSGYAVAGKNVKLTQEEIDEKCM